MPRQDALSSLPPGVFERHGYLEVHVRPDPKQPGSKQAAMDALATYRERFETRRFLVVCEDPMPVHDRVDAYWLGDAIAHRLADVRLAVWVPERPIDELEHFTAQIARSRGADVRFYADREKAIAWLLRED